GILKAALVALLSVKDQYYGQSGLYNALYQSDLQVETVSIDGGKASVFLTGTLLMGGECDAPRVQAQLEQTVLQFSTVTEAAIFINGKHLADVLSLK
ncbi:MAG: GerMN domain-containing protein, partial [Chloroflexi bacterium]|nr:GerMN domain-containing protein [Chloroflexota bacterium]